MQAIKVMGGIISFNHSHADIIHVKSFIFLAFLNL